MRGFIVDSDHPIDMDSDASDSGSGGFMFDGGAGWDGVGSRTGSDTDDSLRAGRRGGREVCMRDLGSGGEAARVRAGFSSSSDDDDDQVDEGRGGVRANFPSSSDDDDDDEVEEGRGGVRAISFCSPSKRRIIESDSEESDDASL